MWLDHLQNIVIILHMSGLKVGIVFLACFTNSVISYACSWTLPSGNMSEWVENTTIFWGRPVETKWDRNVTGSWKPATHTNIEMLEVLKGAPPKLVKVHHHTNIGMCGVSFPLGRIKIFVVTRRENGEFYSDEMHMVPVHPYMLHWYFETGEDFSIREMSDRVSRVRRDDEACLFEEDLAPERCEEARFFMKAKESYQSILMKLDVRDRASHRKRNMSWWERFFGSKN